VEGISLPVTDEKLGSRLVKAGLLTEQQLGEILLEEAGLTKEEKRQQPLGQRLVELGFTDEQTVHDIHAQQTQDQVFELAHWQNGIFLYEEPEAMPTFKLALKGNVQELLLDAYRRIDEGQSARKSQGAQTEEELCFACPVRLECTDEIRERYLKLEVCLWRDLATVLDEEYQRVRDARNLYKSKDSGVRPQLDAILDVIKGETTVELEAE
jgi:hypothetical protein